ncbi:olfactory receptor 1500-like [Ranitomeya imitator]|uniref:olfactory receptor 1500-like n=1 Tax=Ranitomeya imitator TaxID=111125 RepID=UPI0037E88239
MTKVMMLLAPYFILCWIQSTSTEGQTEQRSQGPVGIRQRVSQQNDDRIDNDLLITLVQERVPLWDGRDPQHVINSMLRRLWSEVAQALWDGWENAPPRNNLTVVTEFFLLGFQIRQSLRISLFCLLFVVFCGTICGNLLIITLVSTTKSLHTPIHFFISQLSLSDLLVITNIVPNLLQVLLNNGGSIDFVDCITQLYFLCAPEVFECFLLAVMSYDRYVAICNPLRYSTIMTSAHCVKLSIMFWMFGFSIVLVYIVTLAKLNFCGPNIIDHLFCDIVPLLEICCSDTFIVHLEIAVMVIPNVIIPTIIIVLSYTFIVSAVLKIKSNVSRQKAFSTCSSHLTVVSIFYWTMFGVYFFPTKGRTLTMSKILSLLYTVFTPFINPIIYSLRNQDIRKAILKHAAW